MTIIMARHLLQQMKPGSEKTRARQGIIICISKGNNRLTPEGFPEDATRLPEFYDGTYKYL